MLDNKSRYTILLYHGVHEDDLEVKLRNSSGKHIPSARFEREMSWLNKNRPLISIADIESYYVSGKPIPDGAVAVNFDDGYLNNYTTAWPILEKYQIPATIYLTTGFIGTGLVGWGDCLEDAIIGSIQTNLEVEIEGSLQYWGLKTDKEKVTAFTQIKAICKSLSEADKNLVISSVVKATGYETTTDNPLYCFMNWEQAREMNASELIEFGAHTVNHIALSRVDDTEMRRQIDISLATVTQELNEPCTHFSYPEGQEKDYSPTVIDYLQKCGIRMCPSAIEGTNVLGETKPFHIHRTMVGFEGREFPLQ